MNIIFKKLNQKQNVYASVYLNKESKIVKIIFWVVTILNYFYNKFLILFLEMFEKFYSVVLFTNDLVNQHKNLKTFTH